MYAGMTRTKARHRNMWKQLRDEVFNENLMRKKGRLVSYFFMSFETILKCAKIASRSHE
jgi:hypothetical protein